MEVDRLKRIALGAPGDGGGHHEEHKRLYVAIVPWAPLLSRPEALERYVT